MLEVVEVSKTFSGRGGAVRAVDGVSLSVGEGECLGLVGESGSGKSTLGSIVAGVIEPDTGAVVLDGHRYEPGSASARRRHQRRLQLVFQDPRASFDPRTSIGEALAEPVRHKRRLPRSQHAATVTAALERIGLPASVADRDIEAVSGGQAQRIAIARAVLAEPVLVVCDEITSALDVAAQADVLELLARVRTEQRLTLLFISHDLEVVSQVADRVAVMAHGRVVDEGPVGELLDGG